ncbi:MAG: hypothetical protein FGM54_00600 [Chitinophagaceae bacterium]|nr:hypothetical protein [Chitinophagaceae bacterium]
MFNGIVIALIASYIFICAIPYTPAARYMILGALLAAGVIGLPQKRFNYPPKSSVILGLSLFVCVAFVSAVLSPYSLDSLQGFRKDYLPPLFVLVIATSLKQSAQGQLLAATVFAWALLAGFVVKTLLALWDGAFNHPFIFSPYSNPVFVETYGLPKYVSFYAVESVLYLMVAYSHGFRLTRVDIIFRAIKLTKQNVNTQKNIFFLSLYIFFINVFLRNNHLLIIKFYLNLREEQPNFIGVYNHIHA